MIRPSHNVRRPRHGAHIVLTFFLAWGCVACAPETSIHPEPALTTQDEELARYQLNGTWTGALTMGERDYTWTWTFASHTLHARLDDVAQDPVAWRATYVRPDVMVIVVHHPEGLTESTLRFDSPNRFHLDALPDVSFEREHRSSP